MVLSSRARIGLLSVLGLWLSAPAHAQLILDLTQASQSGALNSTLTFDGTLMNLSNQAISWNGLSDWEATGPGGSTAIVISGISTSLESGTLAAGQSINFNAGSSAGHMFSVTVQQAGQWSGALTLLRNGSAIAHTNFQAGTNTPPPPTLLVTLAGGALMALRTRIPRRKTTS